MLTDELPGLIDASLAALASDRSEVGLIVEVGRDGANVTLGRLALYFGHGRLADMLAWERLVDALPRAVELARLGTAHRASGATWPAAWSVHTTATTLAWLVWATGGRGKSRWGEIVRTILAAADIDGDVLLTSDVAPHMVLDGTLRSRGLLATIRVSPRIRYVSSIPAFLTPDVVPATIASASAGRHVADLIEIPWLTGSGVTVDHVVVCEKGTRFVLNEPMLPLAKIPGKAMAAVGAGGCRHAPWSVTTTEREAVDVVDAAAHRLG